MVRLDSCMNFYWLRHFFSCSRLCKHASCLSKFFCIMFSFLRIAFSECSIIFLTYSFSQCLKRVTSCRILCRLAWRGWGLSEGRVGERDSMRSRVLGSARRRVILRWKCCAFLGSNWM